jgi:hypothetical protein
MPFTTTSKLYTMRVPPEFGACARFSALWGVYTRSMDDDDEMNAPDEHCGRDYHVLFKAAVGPHHKIRRKVRMSAWLAPTADTQNDATYNGMAIDEGNECEVVMGTPVPFHFRELKGSTPSGAPDFIFAGVTVFVEWNAMDKNEILFIPTIDTPLAYLQIIPRGMDILSPARLALLTAEDAKFGVETSGIPPRPASPPPPASRHSVDAGKGGRAKRSRASEEALAAV